MGWQIFAHRLRALLWRRRLERDLDAELEFHRAMVDAMGSGHRFGNELRVREQAREAWMFAWLETLGQDLRFAWRGMRRAPGFTLAVVATLALGIGANSAIFGLAYAVLWQPLPYPNAGRIVEVRQAHDGRQWMRSSGFDIAAARKQSVGLEDWSMYRGDQATLTGAGDPAVLVGAEMEAGAFRLLGAKPALGRLILPSDDHPGAAPVVLLSARLWQKRWNANPAIVGKPIVLDGVAYTVIGVLPEGFEFPRVEYWRAWQEKPGAPGTRMAASIARLAPGVSIGEAQRRANQQMQRLAGVYPQDKGWGFHLVPLRKAIAGDTAPELYMMLAVAGLVLLIAAANVACLLSAQTQRRMHELATRAALGASRGRILRQLWTGTAVLTACGVAAGLALAAGGIAWLRASAPGDMPRMDHVVLDWPVVGFAAAAAAFVMIVFGLAPAWSASGRGLNASLRAARTVLASGRVRGRSAWVVAQVALAVVLLAGAGLLLGAFVRMRAVPLGFQPRHVLSFGLSLPATRYPNDASRWRFYLAAERRFDALPGVGVSALALTMPFVANEFTVYSLPGKPAQPNDFSQMIGYNAVGGGYFRTLQIPLLAGRGFAAADTRTSAPVAVINLAAARELFSGRSPLGQRIKLGSGKAQWLTIVGTVGDVQPYVPESPMPPPMILYVPLLQAGYIPQEMMFMVRSHGNPLGLLPEVRHAVARLDPAMPLDAPHALTDLYRFELAQPRFRGWLVGGFAGLALVLTALGIFGVLAYSVGGRTQELGVRAALGAQPRQVLAMVLRQALGLIAAGLAIGLGLAAGLTRYLHALLFGISPTNGWILGGVALLMLLVGLAAAMIPARRAMQVDPARALRCD